MKTRLENTLLALCLLLSVPLAATGAVPGYSRSAVATPRGISGGWALSPTETPASNRQAALLVGNPQNSQDSKSALYFVDKTSTSVSLSAYEKYSEVVGAVKCDLDNDGLADALVWYTGRPYFKVYFGDKPLRTTVRTYEDTLRLGSPDTLALADLNHDGLPEILAWYSTLRTVYLLWQDTPVSGSSDRFRRFDNIYIPPASSSSTGSQSNALSSSRFLFGDFNADGIPDFIFQGYLCLGDSLGKFSSKALTAQEASLSAQAAFDLDSDGQTELLGIKNDPVAKKDRAYILKLNASDVFTGNTFFSLGFQGVSYTDYFDYNGDSYPDLLCGGNGIVSMLKGTGVGKLATGPADTVIAATRSLSPLGVTDWGNDGLWDWLFLTARADSLVVYSPTDSRFMDATVKAGLDRSLAGSAVAVGDYNNDGLPDIFILNSKGYNALFQGQSGGRFVDVAEQAGVSQANDGISCAWGDYDNDGFQDLFIAGFSLPSKLFHNNGNGTFADSSKIIGLDQSGRRASSVCWGDVNRDGWLDLLLGDYDGTNWLLVNQIGRKFIDRSQDFGLSESYKTESAVLVDVDADGWLDIVSLNDGGPIRLLLGSDKGFSDATAASGLNVGSSYGLLGQSQSWGDFNGDGYPDLYVTRAQDVDALYLNTGRSGGTRFERKFSDYVESRYGRLASAIADLDEDSRPDLLIARASVFGDFSGSSTDLFFTNPGQYPNPADKSGGDPGLRRAADSALPVAYDFDGDGDLDLLYVNYLPNNRSDLFHGSPLPLGYSENKAVLQRNLVVRIKRIAGRSPVGTRLLLCAGGKTRLQSISGGSGRVQTGGTPLWSLGQSAFADSLVVIWPNQARQTLPGPLLAGTLTINEDQTGPTIKLLPSPDGIPVNGEFSSTQRTLSVNLEVQDPAGVKWVRIVFFDSTTTVADTASGQPAQSGEVWTITRRAPGPGQWQRFYFEAADMFGNQSREPSGGIYSLANRFLVTRGDINFDNRINVFDLLRLMQLIGGAVPSEAEKVAADIDQNGKLNSSDLSLLLKMI